MAITRINNNQITDASAGNVYLGVNAAVKLQDYTITAGKIQNNLTYGSDLTITGNLTVNGNTTTIDTVNLVVEDPLILLAKEQTGSPSLDIGFIGKRGTEDNIAWVWDESADEFAAAFTTSEVTNTTISINGYASIHALDLTARDANLSGNLTFEGTILGNVTVTGNLDADNVNATTNVTGTTITASGNLVGGNAVISGDVGSATVTATGNVSGGNLTTAGVVTATGNVTGGNITTAGVVDATGNVTGGNLVTAGNVDGANVNATSGVTAGTTVVATGNVTGGNITTAGDVTTATVTASGNIDGANINASADVTAVNVIASGNVDAGNVNITTALSVPNLSVSGNVLAGNLNSNAAVTGVTITASGNVSGGNLTTAGAVDATGNVIGGNLTTGGVVTATGNVTGGNIITGGAVEATGNVSGGNVNATADVTAVNVIASGNVDGANINTDSIVGTAITITGTSVTMDLTGNLSMSGRYINQLGTPVADTDAATKQYVDDAVSTGITIHTPVRLESPTNLTGTYAQGGTTATVTDTVAGNTVVFSSAISPQVNDQYWFSNSFQGIVANTPYFVVSAPNTSAAVLSTSYNGSPVSNITSASGLTESVRINSGQGATLTNSGANATLVVDGVTVNTNDRILVYTQTDPIENGVYVVSDAGNASAAWVLTRSTDTNTYKPNDITGLDAGDYFYVTAGDTGAGESYVMTAPTGPVIIGYANLTFTQFSASQVYTANTSAGLVLNGTTFSAKVDNDTTAFDGSGNISVKAGANLTTPNIGDATGNSLTLSGNGLLSATTVTATGNVSGGNLTTAGDVTTATVTASGNINGANVNATSGVTAGTTVTATGNVSGGNLTTAGAVDATGNVTGGNINTAGQVVATGNVTGGNVNTAGTVVATGNVDGGNLNAASAVTAGTTVTATGNVSGGNVTTAGAVDATGNVTGGNLNTAGQIVATGNVTGGNLVTAGNIDGANVNASAGITAGTTVVATGNVTGGNLVTAGAVDATGNVTGGNVNTAGTVVATGNVDGGNVNTAGQVVATGNVSGGNLVTTGTADLGNIRITGNDITNFASNIITINSAGSDIDLRVSGDTQANLLVVDAGTDTVIVGSGTPTAGASLKVGTSDSMMVPVGNTAQRPGTPALGMFRFNSAGDALEVYASGGWEDVGVPAFTVITADAFVGNGVETVFTLSSDSTTAATIVSINGIVQEPTTAYSVSGNTLTFTEAPAVSDNIDARLLTTTTTVVAIENAGGTAVVEAIDGVDTIQITGNLLPAANVLYNLGSGSARWNELYLAGNTIALGNIVIKETSATTIGFFEGDGTTPATIDASSVDTTSIANGTANVRTFSNANVAISAGGNANVGLFTGSGLVVSGSIEATGGFIGLDATQIQDGTSNVSVISSGGNVDVNIGGSPIVTFHAGGMDNRQSNGVGNIGTATSYFNTVFAKATSAQYADLAEMYEADGNYEPGTVLCFGGTKEVTLCDEAECTRVAGVVSTNPSYLMNSGQTGEYVAAVALQGRVPCRVTGTIKKGDLIVSADGGRGRANNNARVGSVIGKALADFEGADGVIEVVVGRV